MIICLCTIVYNCILCWDIELQNYQTSGGPPPQTSITMCFGEELLNTDDPAAKLITVNVSKRQLSQNQFQTPARISALNNN